MLCGPPQERLTDAFAELEAAGVVAEFCGMKRNRCWCGDDVLTGLDEFVGRRRASS